MLGRAYGVFRDVLPRRRIMVLLGPVSYRRRVPEQRNLLVVGKGGRMKVEGHKIEVLR